MEAGRAAGELEVAALEAIEHPGTELAHVVHRDGRWRYGLETILVVLVLVSLLSLFANIVTRALLNFGLVWTYELAQLCLIALTFLGGAYAYRRGEHMSLRVVVDNLPAAWRPWAAAASRWSVFWVSLAVGALALPVLPEEWIARTAILAIPRTFAMLPVPLGMGLICAFVLVEVRSLARWPAVVAGLVVPALGAAWVVASQVVAFDPSLVLAAVMLAFAVLLVLGVPVAFAFMAVALLYITQTQVATPTVTPVTMEHSTENFLLLAIPFFIVAGLLMTEGGLSLPLARFVRSLVGHIRGGLLQVIVVAMYLFSGVSGSKLADVAGIGTSMRDMLNSGGYDRGESAAVLASSAAMGETVPPSIAMLVLASVTSLSVGTLFVAGLLPAAVVALCLIVAIYLKARLTGDSTGERFRPRAVLSTGLLAVPAMMVPAILLVGILFGIATPTEASTFAVVYGVLVAGTLYRQLKLRVAWQILVDSAALAGMLLFIIAAAASFSYVLTVAQVPHHLASLLASSAASSLGFMVAAVVLLLVAGSILEGLPAMLVFAPLLFPVATQLGISPLHFGIVMVIALGIGAFAPPVGSGFYVACAVMRTSMESASRSMALYVCVLVIGVLVVAFVPSITLSLPRAFHMIP